MVSWCLAEFPLFSIYGNSAEFKTFSPCELAETVDVTPLIGMPIIMVILQPN